ncbi:DMT family transporter [Streptomyces sp. S1D4-11]
MSALALSVLLSFVSAVAYAGGAIVQEQVALTSPDQTYAPLRRPGWWAAVALSGVGGVLHVVALAYGPLSLVQPLGALTIVFALPMAAVFVGRKAGATAWRGAIMATGGLAVLLALVGSAEAQSLSDTQITVLAVVSGGAVAAFMVAGRAAHRHPAVRSVMLAVGSGIAFSMSSVFTKTVAVDWSHQVSLSDLPSLALIGVFATAGMLLSQASYRGGGLAAPLATLTVVNPVVAAAVGITMFGETFRYGETGTVLALACGVVAAGGLILLTTEQIGSARNTAEVAASAVVETEPAPEEATPYLRVGGAAARGAARAVRGTGPRGRADHGPWRGVRCGVRGGVRSRTRRQIRRGARKRTRSRAHKRIRRRARKRTRRGARGSVRHRARERTRRGARRGVRHRARERTRRGARRGVRHRARRRIRRGARRGVRHRARRRIRRGARKQTRRGPRRGRLRTGSGDGEGRGERARLGRLTRVVRGGHAARAGLFRPPCAGPT